ncbi:hypothetical protein I4U23_024384 [Adineta vaga]|nr:hypothetical protein I4U23_024384 [Adineta vaga]
MASSNERIHHERLPSASRMYMNNGTSSTNNFQQPSFASDYKEKFKTHAILSRASPQNSIPLTTMQTNGEYSMDQSQKVDDVDLSKKFFMDRQIKKVKSLSGLIKGTVLTHHSPIQTTTTYTDSTIRRNHDDLLLSNDMNHHEDAILTRQHSEQMNETRRPRVSFSDFDKIQYFDDHTSNHRHRYRSARRSNSTTNNNNHNHTPPILLSSHSEIPNPSHRRQESFAQESNIKKQQIITSPYSYSSRLTHLPDLLTQASLPVETSLPERHILQRERPLLSIPEPVAEMPINSSTDVSRESTRSGGIRPSAIQIFNDQHDELTTSDGGLRTSFSNSSISSLSMNRQRSSLRTISLRQQFASPTRLKTSTSQKMLVNPRRSSSLNYNTSRTQSSRNDLDEINETLLLSAFGHRPMTDLNSSKRNYIVHFDSKRSGNGFISPTSSSSTTTLITDANERNHEAKSTTPLQSALKLVRSPYSSTMTNSNDRIRSSHTNNEHVPTDFYSVSNTIYV